MNGKTLSNKHGITLNGSWELPLVGTPGTIQNRDAGDHGYLSTNGNTEAGSAVEEVALVAYDDGQQWERSADDDSDYFTLKNPKSGRFLYRDNLSNSLTIEGTASFHCVGFFTMLFFTYRFSRFHKLGKRTSAKHDTTIM